jgi:hypothetical protein
LSLVFDLEASDGIVYLARPKEVIEKFGMFANQYRRSTGPWRAEAERPASQDGGTVGHPVRAGPEKPAAMPR